MGPCRELTVALVVAQVGALDALDVHHLVQVVLRDAVLRSCDPGLGLGLR